MKKSTIYIIQVIAVLAAAWVLSLLLPVSVGAQNGYPQLTNFVVVRPQAIPASATDVIKQDAYVCYADFTATGQNLSVQDRQATPTVWLNAPLGTASTATTWFFTPTVPNGCRPMPNGITIQAGATGVTGTMVIGCPQRCKLTWGF